jgi:hypothetical protein
MVLLLWVLLVDLENRTTHRPTARAPLRRGARVVASRAGRRVAHPGHGHPGHPPDPAHPRSRVPASATHRRQRTRARLRPPAAHALYRDTPEQRSQTGSRPSRESAGTGPGTRPGTGRAVPCRPIRVRQRCSRLRFAQLGSRPGLRPGWGRGKRHGRDGHRDGGTVPGNVRHGPGPNPGPNAGLIAGPKPGP